MKPTLMDFLRANKERIAGWNLETRTNRGDGEAMTSRDFAYWLQGFFENAKPKTINKAQTEQIKKRLALVFAHEIDPSAGDEGKQKVLNAIHHGNEGPVTYRC